MCHGWKLCSTWICFSRFAYQSLFSLKGRVMYYTGRYWFDWHLITFFSWIHHRVVYPYMEIKSVLTFTNKI